VVSVVKYSGLVVITYWKSRSLERQPLQLWTLLA